MNTAHHPRPQIHLLAGESDVVAGIALVAESRQPVVAAMLLEEIERAILHDDPSTMPTGYVRLNSFVTYTDEKSEEVREVQLVLPAEADIEQGKVSILTPIGAALYGLAEGHEIRWPDLFGKDRVIRIIRVAEPGQAADA